MTIWRRRLVLVLALAVMPLQGIAATLFVLLCHGDAQAHAMHAQDAHDDHEHGLHHHGDPDEGGAAGQSAHHPCCNVTASAPPVMTPGVEALRFPVGAPAPDSLHDLFVPEQPQRPPLS